MSGLKVTRIATAGQELAGGYSLDASYVGDDVDVTTGLPVDGLLDVNAPTPADGEVLTWDDAAGEWIAGPGGGPDVDLVTVAASGATETIDVDAARTYDVTLTADCTFTFAGAVTAEAWPLTLLLRQDVTGSRTVTWPSAVEWGDAGAPILSTAPAEVDIIELLTLDGGVTWFGSWGGASLTPASTVEDETTWGITPAVGSDTEYARQDHTHGTPAEPPRSGEILIADVPLDFPHGTFFTTASQTVGSTTTAYAVAFAGEGDVDGLTHSTVTNNSRIYIDQSGEYNIIVTAIGDLTSGTNQHIDVWLAIDNANVDNSNTIVQVVSTAETLIAASYNLDLTAGSYFEIKYHGDSTACQLLQTAAAASPTRPASPAVLLTVNMESPVAGFVSKGVTLLLNDAGDDLLYADTA